MHSKGSKGLSGAAGASLAAIAIAKAVRVSANYFATRIIKAVKVKHRAFGVMPLGQLGVLIVLFSARH